MKIIKGGCGRDMKDLKRDGEIIYEIFLLSGLLMALILAFAIF